METTNKVQLNASLRFNPAGELVGRDLLINFREQSVADCVKLLGDFNRQFKINLGLPEQTSTTPLAESATSDIPNLCPTCQVPLLRRQVKNPSSKSYGKAFLGCGNYNRTGCLYSYWL